MMLDHTQAHKLLHLSLDASLPKDQRQALDDHLQECSACRSYAAQMRSVENRLAGTSLPGEPPAVLTERDLARKIERVRAKVKRNQMSQRVRQVSSTFVYAGLLLAAGFVLIWALNNLRAQQPAGITPIETELPITTPLPAVPPVFETPLPQSMKGYELYSWQVGDQWSFTLITGTNRNKTVDEIVSTENTVAGDGMIKITVQGVDALKAVLDQLPTGASIFWMDGSNLDSASPDRSNITRPPQEIVSAVQEYCQSLGLDLHVSGQIANDDLQTYTDPLGYYSLHIPLDWKLQEESSGAALLGIELQDQATTFAGADGSLRTGYLPEMAFMDSTDRVCQRLANTPQGPARQINLAPLPQADGCILSPLPEMSIDQVVAILENPAGKPQQRYFFIESNAVRMESLLASVEFLVALPEHPEFPYPTGAMRPEDEAFWQKVDKIPADLVVEEHAVVAADEDSPTHFEFFDRIPAEVRQRREALRTSGPLWLLTSNNALLEPFGYALKAQEGTEMVYQLYRGEELILGDFSQFWPVSVSTSGQDFAMVVEVLNGGSHLVRAGSLEEWDMGSSLFTPPVFYGDDLLSVRWDGERSQVQVIKGNEVFYSFSSMFMVSMPVMGFWSWNGHWLLEVDGFLIQDGENLNETFGFEEIFGWQLLDGKPFYYFRKGPRIGISYAGQVVPLAYYDEVVHYRCCEPAAFNNSGNDRMAWFYGLREGTWYYVEMGVFSEPAE